MKPGNSPEFTHTSPRTAGCVDRFMSRGGSKGERMRIAPGESTLAAYARPSERLYLPPGESDHSQALPNNTRPHPRSRRSSHAGFDRGCPWSATARSAVGPASASARSTTGPTPGRGGLACRWFCRRSGLWQRAAKAECPKVVAMLRQIE